MLLVRGLNGKLTLKNLDTKILIGDLFAQCKTDKEVEWLQEQLTGIVDCMVEERNDEIEGEE